MSESQKSGKADETLALKGETNENLYSGFLATQIHAFYTKRGGLCAVKSTK